MGSIFDYIDKITDFQILSFNPKVDSEHEPWDGRIEYDRQVHYFSYHHEFDIGNTYIVYAFSGIPMYYFMLYNDIYVAFDSPMLKYEQ